MWLSRQFDFVIPAITPSTFRLGCDDEATYDLEVSLIKKEHIHSSQKEYEAREKKEKIHYIQKIY